MCSIVAGMFVGWKLCAMFAYRTADVCSIITRSAHGGKHIGLSSEISTPRIVLQTRMWANAQRDGRPAEYRWRPLFDVAKFGWRPVIECRALTLPRRETRWNLLGYPKFANRSQPLLGRSSPYCEDVWGRYCCLTSFFPIVDTCLSCEDIARTTKLCDGAQMAFFASCISSEPHACTFQTGILNSH